MKAAYKRNFAPYAIGVVNPVQPSGRSQRNHRDPSLELLGRDNNMLLQTLFLAFHVGESCQDSLAPKTDALEPPPPKRGSPYGKES